MGTFSSTTTIASMGGTLSSLNESSDGTFSEELNTTLIASATTTITNSLNMPSRIEINIAQGYIESLSEEELAQLTTAAEEKYEELKAINIDDTQYIKR